MKIKDYLNKVKEEVRLDATKWYIENECPTPDDNYLSFMSGFEVAWQYIGAIIGEDLEL